ncbi:MAG: hypothetical protein AUJ92_16180 [Armatimonadetes bacterium CG2_30_59_28]|nr:diguanylate cyclase [Armatimonadota bacterium]OIO91634.1 MAG: hypothetical protein AUJ92_16180 [Armatimonadetes bacterium CG2_30_59_28]PIU61993.1 MAG: hypothetical protein COS85_19855 [Armatimonadetes bacterium CG07_land_8_20_14_0_80_59_28]PIY43040.1 MAG: hypothetical protein COZ05_12345 [Armatimonadetes bacterium CG_4_10_14_3_um_filter_59_10]PJB61984.1 MAG: hypothetical protein CO095_19535 [Armatimonadetes bacterium CG_4_9_14_3_um_filter_58_7]
MYKVKQQSVIVTIMAFVLILILSSLFSRSEPPMGLWVSFVVVSLIVANLLGLLAVQLHRLEAEAVTDPLTGAFNRRYFEKRLDQEIKRSDRMRRPMAMMFVDIDNFKPFNDTHGHTAGDKAIRWIVESVSECIREMDVISRYGGEEFVVLLPEADLDNAATVAERARQLIQSESARELSLGNENLTVTIGVAAYRFEESGTSFLQRADQAMYHGKMRGKNQTSLDRHDARGTVLVVEAEQGKSDQLARALSREGYHVDIADSNDEAMSVSSHGRYDLLVTDANVAGITCSEILKGFRIRHSGTPAIVVAHEVRADERETLAALGNVDLLIGNINGQELVSRASQVLGNQRETEGQRP